MNIFEWWNENLAIPLCPEADKKFEGLHVIGTCGECRHGHAIKGENPYNCAQYISCGHVTSNEVDFLKTFGCIHFEPKKDK